MSEVAHNHPQSGVGTCHYGPCTRVLPNPCVVLSGIAYCSEACASASTKASPFYRHLGGDWSY